MLVKNNLSESGHMSEDWNEAQNQECIKPNGITASKTTIEIAKEQ